MCQQSASSMSLMAIHINCSSTQHKILYTVFCPGYLEWWLDSAFSAVYPVYVSVACIIWEVVNVSKGCLIQLRGGYSWPVPTSVGRTLCIYTCMYETMDISKSILNKCLLHVHVFQMLDLWHLTLSVWTHFTYYTFLSPQRGWSPTFIIY